MAKKIFKLNKQIEICNRDFDLNTYKSILPNELVGVNDINSLLDTKIREMLVNILPEDEILNKKISLNIPDYDLDSINLSIITYASYDDDNYESPDGMLNIRIAANFSETDSAFELRKNEQKLVEKKERLTAKQIKEIEEKKELERLLRKYGAPI